MKLKKYALILVPIFLSISVMQLHGLQRERRNSNPTVSGDIKSDFCKMVSMIAASACGIILTKMYLTSAEGDADLYAAMAGFAGLPFYFNDRSESTRGLTVFTLLTASAITMYLHKPSA